MFDDTSSQLESGVRDPCDGLVLNTPSCDHECDLHRRLEGHSQRPSADHVCSHSGHHHLCDYPASRDAHGQILFRAHLVANAIPVVVIVDMLYELR